MSMFSSDSDRLGSDRDAQVHESIELISDEMDRKLELQSNDESNIHREFEDDHEDEDEDFTFTFTGDKDAPIYADRPFQNGQIRPVFPLFDQNLLLDGGEYEVEEIDRLPTHPTVDKIFIESPRGRHPSDHADNDTSGPFCVWSKETGTAVELSKKSNSTGFSKLWRIREKVNRSNSDGRDAFVFLKTAATSSSSNAKTVNTGNRSVDQVNVSTVGGKAVNRVTKAKKPKVSAHEAYMKSKGGHTEEERRRSYLPYRPELMGFFTNVHGGLSRNVHPY